MRSIFAVLAIVLLAAGALGGTVYVKPKVVSIQPPTPVSKPSKLYINPSSRYAVLKPGESLKFTVTIKNTKNKTVTLKPELHTFPFTTSMFLKWVKVNLSKTVLKPGESTNAEVTISIPKNAEEGHYSCILAFTNDSIYLPYSHYKLYVNSVQISVDVRTPPDVYIYPMYLSLNLVKGETKNVSITVVNRGNRTYSINPAVSCTPEYYVFPPTACLNSSMVKVSAPKVIPPHSKVFVNLTFHAAAPGSYRGILDLNINDTKVNQKVNLFVRVVSMPEKPYVRKFTIKNVKALRVTVRFSSYNSKIIESVKLISPDGKVVKPTSIVEESSISYTSYPVKIKPGYSVNYNSVTFVYNVSKPENGLWKVAVKTPYSVNIKIVKFL